MKMLNYIRKVLAIIGMILMFSAISTMDFYTKELLQDIPTYLFIMLLGGAILTLPTIIHDIWDYYKGDKFNDDVFR